MIDPNEFMTLSKEGKLDSRLKTPTATHPQYKLERTYCIVCGKPKGWVSQESYKYIKANSIILVCEDCEGCFGTLPLPKANITEIKKEA